MEVLLLQLPLEGEVVELYRLIIMSPTQIRLKMKLIWVRMAEKEQPSTMLRQPPMMIKPLI